MSPDTQLTILSDLLSDPFAFAADTSETVAAAQDAATRCSSNFHTADRTSFQLYFALLHSNESELLF